MWFAERPLLRIALLEGQLVIDCSDWRGRGELSTVQALTLDSAAPGAPNWQPALDRLASWLKEKAVQRARMHIHLSNCFVRWQLLEWQPKVTHPQELSAYVHMRFRATYGARVEQWHMHHPLVRPGNPLPVCAIDKPLIAALTQLQSIGDSHVLSVRPYFSAAFDRWRSRWGNKTAWFGVTEPSHFTLSLMHKGAWRGLRTMRQLTVEAGDDWKSILPSLQSQIGLTSGLEVPSDAPVFLAGSATESGRRDVPGLVWLDSNSRREPTQGLARMAWGI